MKIAQALLLRKQLEKKVNQLEPIRLNGEKGLFETNIKRVSVSETTDEITVNAPKITFSEVTKEYDKYATALRKLDASIQKANWEFDVDFSDKENPLQ